MLFPTTATTSAITAPTTATTATTATAAATTSVTTTATTIARTHVCCCYFFPIEVQFSNSGSDFETKKRKR